MRLELHDASLAPEAEDDKAGGEKVQRSGLSGGLRKALGSLSSATMKVRACASASALVTACWCLLHVNM